MKPLYYVILYRPSGSKTWTPLSIVIGQGNFFASKESARAYTANLNAQKMTLERKGKKVPIELAIGAVRMEEEVKA